MVAIGVWRHVLRRVPLACDPSYWSMVFPLGMYAAATGRLLDVEQAPRLVGRSAPNRAEISPP